MCFILFTSLGSSPGGFQEHEDMFSILQNCTPKFDSDVVHMDIKRNLLYSCADFLVCKEGDLAVDDAKLPLHGRKGQHAQWQNNVQILHSTGQILILHHLSAWASAGGGSYIISPDSLIFSCSQKALF